MSLALSKFVMLATLAFVSVHAVVSLRRDLLPRSKEADEALQGAIGTGFILILILLTNALPALNAVYYHAWEELTAFEGGFDGRLDVAGMRLKIVSRQVEVVAITVDLALIIWAGVGRVALHSLPLLQGSAGQPMERRMRSVVDGLKRGDVAVRAGALFVGMILLQLAGGNVSLRWLLWILFIPLALSMFDGVVDALIRLMQGARPPARRARG